MRWAVAVALLLLAPSSAWASHMTAYRTQPVEHDDLGRSHEPDFAATSVLGLPLLNCAVDAPPFWSSATARCGDDAAPTGLFVGHATYPGHELAPGCTRDSAAATPAQPEPERAPSGLCGLWTVGVRPNNAAQVVPPASVGEDGMNVPAGIAPGAFSPGNGSEVVFLDGKLTFTYGISRWVPFQESLGDAGLEASRGWTAYSYIPWAWFGKWRDLNGNGVIDHLTPGTAGPTQNEFTFFGSCVDGTGWWNPPVPGTGKSSIELGLCKEEVNPHVPGAAPCWAAAPGVPCGAKTTLDLWMFPGNHHGGEVVTCPWGFLYCAADIPGMQVVMWALRGLDCTGPPSCDDAASSSYGSGDPLLDHPYEVAVDDAMFDKTGDPDTNRQWVGFWGLNGAIYDEGLLSNLVAVFGANCAPAPAAPQLRDLASCTFVDVDHHQAVHPLTHELLFGGDVVPAGGLKGVARAHWVLVRDHGPGLLRLADSVVNGRALYEASLGPQQGVADDLVVDGGWSREPNHPLDAYPGVAWAPCPADAWPSPGEAQHRGYCNVPVQDPLTGATPALTYGLHEGAANGGAFRGWGDVQLRAAVLYYVPFSLFTDPCMLCASGPFLDSPWNPSPPGSAIDPADHGRTIPPGQHYVTGIIGVWRDGPHHVKEAVFPAQGGVETYPADGWPGFLARSTGQYRYRGYADVDAADPADPLMACATEKGPAHGRPRAECNPYLDGNVGDPADYRLYDPGSWSPFGAQEEWEGRCGSADGAQVTVAPAGGVWNTHVIVWRKHAHGLGPLILQNGQANPDWPFAPGGGVEMVRPGDTSPIAVTATCFGSGGNGRWEAEDFLLWPEGNAGDDVLVSATFAIAVDGGVDTVTDVDLYRAWA